MADHDRTFGSNLPVVTDIAGQWTGEADNFKDDISQRFTLDHRLDGVLTEGAADQDGRHRQVTMKELAADPTNMANAGILYTKDVDDVTELFYEDDTGQVTQITDDGALNYTTIVKDIEDIISDATKLTGTAGNASAGASVQTNISYPSGYTKENTIVMESKVYNTSFNGYEQANSFTYNSGILGARVLLTTSYIVLESTYYNNAQSYTIVVGKLS